MTVSGGIGAQGQPEKQPFRERRGSITNLAAGELIAKRVEEGHVRMDQSWNHAVYGHGTGELLGKMNADGTPAGQLQFALPGRPSMVMAPTQASMNKSVNVHDHELEHRADLKTHIGPASLYLVV